MKTKETPRFDTETATETNHAVQSTKEELPWIDYALTIQGMTPYTASMYHGDAKENDREGADDYEKRTWKSKLRTDENGNTIISGDAFRFALCSAAQYLGIQIKNKGKRTYTKLFASGIIITTNLRLGITRDEIKGINVYVNADGVRGSGKRVMRTFPCVREWGGTIQIRVLDPAITEDILKQHCVAAGKYIGVGQYRVERGGTNGRFEVVNLKRITPD